MTGEVRKKTAICAAALLSAVITACTPPVPLVGEDQYGSSTAVEGPRFDSLLKQGIGDQNYRVLGVAVDPVTSAVNPFVAHDFTPAAVVLAKLSLPGAFVDGEINKDLLDGAQRLDLPRPNAALTVLYSIKEGAQWSDGQPVTGADFSATAHVILDTPGTQSDSPYRLISAISTSVDGRSVTVDFSSPVKNWKDLFPYLLPAHLTRRGTHVTTSASAGRWMIDKIDQDRNIVELKRNARWWGSNPAVGDAVRLMGVTRKDELIQLLSTGQVKAAAVTPQQTWRESLELTGKYMVDTVTEPFVYRASFVLDSPQADTKEKRAALCAAIDANQVARLAAGRSEELGIVQQQTIGTCAAQAMTAPTGEIIVGADASDGTARTAAITVADQLRKAGYSARVDSAPLGDLLDGEDKPTMIIARQELTSTPAALASRFLCRDHVAPLSKTKTKGGMNFSGFCDRDIDQQLVRMLAGKVDEKSLRAKLQARESQELLGIDLLPVTILLVSAHSSVVGEDDSPADQLLKVLTR